MRINDAYAKAHAINRTKRGVVARVSKNTYGGYSVVVEPYVLPIVRASLDTIASNHRGFNQNFKLKYGSSRKVNGNRRSY